MCRLSTLCRKLKRTTGRSYCVRGVSRTSYRVYLLDDVSKEWNHILSVHSVSAVESFLLSQFL